MVWLWQSKSKSLIFVIFALQKKHDLFFILIHVFHLPDISLANIPVNLLLGLIIILVPTLIINSS